MVWCNAGYLDVNIKEEPSAVPVHHRAAGRSKSGCGRSSNAPPTPWIPPLWKQQYENIRKMRETRNAPVDTHGCFMLAERDVAPEVSASGFCWSRNFRVVKLCATNFRVERFVELTRVAHKRFYVIVFRSPHRPRNIFRSYPYMPRFQWNWELFLIHIHATIVCVFQCV